MKLITVISFIYSTLTVISAQEDAPQIKISDGILRGGYRHTWKGKKFKAFTGIPYAKPPVGNLRFEAAVPVEPWDGILDTSKLHPVCVQVNIFSGQLSPHGKEDCLFLNVFTPLDISKNRKLPVMFYIPGGGWSCADGNPDHYGPDYLLEKDVVFVSINYRIGAFGFLSTENATLPGNNGLKDQVLALKWVQKNIKYFGGDPKRVTIVGHSAGAASVVFHFLSPLSQGLFVGGIAQSGSAIASWALARPGRMLTNFKRLAQYLNCPTAELGVTIRCLKSMDAYDIVNQDKKFYDFSFDPMSPYMPVVETVNEEAFLAEYPMDLMKSGRVANIPLMIGITSEDGAVKSELLHRDAELIKTLNRDFTKLLPIIFAYEDNEGVITKSVRKFYFNNKDIDNSTKTELTELFTDYQFFLPVDTTVRKLAQHSQQTFYYVFGYRGRVALLSLFYGANNDEYGVAHSDDLYYLLSRDLFEKYPPNDEEAAMRELMVTLWTNFATFGNPTPFKDSVIKNRWTPATSGKGNYYNIKSPTDTKMNINLYEKRMKFWHNVWHKHSMKLEL